MYESRSRKIALIEQIIQLEDKAVFSRLRNAVQKTLRPSVSSKPSRPPLSDEEVGQQLREARQQATAGDTIPVDEVAKLAQQWRTK